MSVGDGTWDFETNSFLLPNLMGLDFQTMRYNGTMRPRESFSPGKCGLD